MHGTFCTEFFLDIQLLNQDLRSGQTRDILRVDFILQEHANGCEGYCLFRRWHIYHLGTGFWQREKYGIVCACVGASGRHACMHHVIYDTMIMV